MKYAIFQPTPKEAVGFIKDIIQDKVVFDLGAGDGRFAFAMADYAKKVVAVEEDEMLAGDCELRGLETIKNSFLDISLEEADVLFIFMSFIGNYALTKKLIEEGWEGTVISHYYPLQDSPTSLWEPTQVIDVNAGGMRFPFLVYRI